MEDGDRWTGCECEYCSNEGDIEHCWALQRITELIKEIEKLKSERKEMKINFNQLRVNIVKDYNELINFLNNSIVVDEDTKVVIPAQELIENVNKLKNNIGILCSVYEKDDPDVQDISNKVSLEEFTFMKG